MSPPVFYDTITLTQKHPSEPDRSARTFEIRAPYPVLLLPRERSAHSPQRSHSSCKSCLRKLFTTRNISITHRELMLRRDSFTFSAHVFYIETQHVGSMKGACNVFFGDLHVIRAILAHQES